MMHATPKPQWRTACGSPRMPAPSMPLVKLNDAPANDAPRMSWPAFIAIVVWPVLLGTGFSMTRLDSPSSDVSVAVGRSPLLLLILCWVVLFQWQSEEGMEMRKKTLSKEREREKVSQSISHTKKKRKKETYLEEAKVSFHFLSMHLRVIVFTPTFK